MNPLISPKELLELDASSEYILIDARNSQNPLKTFEESHLKGARFVDPNEELASIKEDLSDGGRHPLPDPKDFSKVLGTLGVSPHSHVIVYDDQLGANSAARFWWMLRAFGHHRIQVLEGGMQAALAIGFPVESGSSRFSEGPAYPESSWLLPLANCQDVEEHLGNEQTLVIDVRSQERYLGLHEPIDLIAGHIPGAVNVPLTESMDASGNFLPRETLYEKFTVYFENRNPKQVIVHCGSGVSACHTLLAMDYAGLEIPSLYVGSWSEWSRNNLPIATGEQS